MEPTSEERTLAAVCHGCGVASSLFLPIIVCLVIYLTKRDESEFVEDQAKEALNFQITMFLLAAIGYLTIFILVGFAVLMAVWLGSIIFPIIAAVKSHSGEKYRYPVNFRIV